MKDKKRFQEIIELSKEMGLDPFPVVYEVIERSTMDNICSYGLPTRARHWSYGRSYDQQKTHHEMGLSKIYEVILNNNPSYAFMLDTNTEVQNMFITAHCCGHCFVPGTLIETEFGIKRIEEIRKRDKVLTHTGKYRNPNGLSKRKHSGELIKIKIGTQEIICTPEHPFLIPKDKETKWIKAEDLSEKDFVSFPITNIMSITTDKFQALKEQNRFDDKYVYFPISKVSKIQRETEVYNLDVPEDSSYVLFAGAVTHNSDFFKNNYMFKDSNRNMIRHAAEHAERIEQYIDKIGLEKVEHIMDIGFALDDHMDWFKGLYRKPYEKKSTRYVKQRRGEFDDLQPGRQKPSMVKRVKNSKFPPHKERDLLWFFTNYAPLEEWEKDVLDIIREERFYFYPQMMTKIINEGWACVCPNSLVFSPNNGIVTAQEFVDKECKSIYGFKNRQEVSDYHVSERFCKTIKTTKGYELAGALNHKIVVWESGQRIWKEIKDLQKNDLVEIRFNQNCFGNYQEINFHSEPKKNGKFNPNVNIPKVVDEKLAKFLGYFSAEGHIGKRCVVLTNGEKSVVEDMCNNVKEVFGLEIVPRKDDNRWRVEIYSVEIINFLKYLEATGKAKEKKVPNVILKSPKSVMISYLSSIFTGDGGAYDSKILCLSSSSKFLINTVRVMLLNVGVFTITYEHYKEGYETNYHLNVFRSDMRKKFANLIETSSLNRSNNLINHKHGNDIGFNDKVYLTGDEKNEIYNIFKDNRQAGLREKGINDYCLNNDYLSKTQLKRIIEMFPEYIPESVLEKFCDDDYILDEISSISAIFSSKVVDFTVADEHIYQAQGFVNHNSYWHAEVMYEYKGIKPDEFVDFLRTHEKVIQPGGNPFRINPYFLGYKIFKDVERRWDEKDGKGAGRKKIFEVRENENDISFIRNYLTPELVGELNLFTFGYAKDYKKGYKGERFIEIKERVRDEVVEALVKPLYNGGAPKISIVEVGPEGKLIMEHESSEVSTLDHKFASKTLEYIWDLWAAPIELHTKDEENNDIILCFDESGFFEKQIGEELNFEEEEEKDDDGPYRGKIIFP